jgi:hypothetical protein
MFKALVISAALVGFTSLENRAEAVVLGEPTFTTAPATVSVVNMFSSFGGDFFPTSRYVLRTSTTIASAQGAPSLVGQSFEFGFDSVSDEAIFSIGGDSATAFSSSPNLTGTGNLFLSGIEDFICTPAGCDLGFRGVYAAFPYDPAKSGSLELQFTLNFALPNRQGFEYCFIDNPSDCRFSNTAGVMEIDGRPVRGNSFTYAEGSVRDATISFATIDGRPVSPVPLPATAWLLIAGIAGLGGMARRKIAAAA